MTSLFQQLPTDIQSNIFTYNELVQDQLKDQVWSDTWMRWYRHLTCPYTRVAMNYLFDRWRLRVYDRTRDWLSDYLSDILPLPPLPRAYSHSCHNDEWCKTIFPDSIQVVLRREDRPLHPSVHGVWIRITNGTFPLFEGWILDAREQSLVNTICRDIEANHIISAIDCEVINPDGLHLWEDMYYHDEPFTVENYYDDAV